jgi:coenzyme F420 hydrogenase subunit beta
LQVVGYEEVGRRWGIKGKDWDFGPCISVYAAESPEREVRERAQDGGAVTALLKTLLEYEYIDGAVVTGFGSEPLLPEPKVITRPEEAPHYAGSKYCRGPIFTAVIDAVKHYGRSRLALVGLPCQVATLRRIQTSSPTNRQIGESVKLVIGLFCQGAFQYKFFKDVVEKQARVPLTEIVRVEVSGDRVILYRKEKPKREIALSIANRYLDPACRLCSDFSSLLADISVGSIGSPAKMSTVVIRTQTGADAFNFTVKMGGIRMRLLESSGLAKAKEAEKKKREEAKRALERMRAAQRSLPAWAGG